MSLKLHINLSLVKRDRKDKAIKIKATGKAGGFFILLKVYFFAILYLKILIF